MTDRELLELAARAYWGDEIDDVVSLEWSEADQTIAYTHGENQDHNGQDVTLLWLPLDPDACDALKLAVKLSIEVSQGVNCDEPAAIAGYFAGTGNTVRQLFAIEPHDGDPCAATCRAIVVAAAEIGKAMP